MEFMRKSDIREVMLCSICDDVMRNPKTLECHHSFCYLCLEKVDKSYRTSSLDGSSQICTIRCQVCGYSQYVSEGNVNSLKDDPTQEKLFQIMTQSPLYLCEVCPEPDAGPTPKQSKAEWMCKECKDCMCKGCADAHIEFDLFRKHELVTIADSQKNQAFCHQHPLKKNDFYCDHCEVLLCSLCTSLHQMHPNSVREAHQYSVHCSERLDDLVGQLDEIYNFPDFKNYENKLAVIKDVNNSLTDLKNKVTEHASMITQDIERQRDQLIRCIEERRALLVYCNHWANATKNMKPYVENLVEKFELYSESKKPADLLVGYGTLYAKVERGVWMHGQNTPSVDSLMVPIDFVPESPQITIGKVVKMGKKDPQAEKTYHCGTKYSPTQRKKKGRNKRFVST